MKSFLRYSISVAFLLAAIGGFFLVAEPKNAGATVATLPFSAKKVVWTMPCTCSPSVMMYIFGHYGGPTLMFFNATFSWHSRIYAYYRIPTPGNALLGELYPGVWNMCWMYYGTGCVVWPAAGGDIGPQVGTSLGV